MLCPLVATRLKRNWPLLVFLTTKRMEYLQAAVDHRGTRTRPGGDQSGSFGMGRWSVPALARSFSGSGCDVTGCELRRVPARRPLPTEPTAAPLPAVVDRPVPHRAGGVCVVPGY